MAWFVNLVSWLKMFLSYREGESSQKDTDHAKAVAAAGVIGQEIVNAQSEAAPVDNTDLAHRLRRDGGL
jgi:hypothetical protein